MAKLFTKKGISRLILILALLLPWFYAFGLTLGFLCGAHGSVSWDSFRAGLSSVVFGRWNGPTSLEGGNYWTQCGASFLGYNVVGGFEFNNFSLFGYDYRSLFSSFFGYFLRETTSQLNSYWQISTPVYWIWGVAIYSLQVVILWSFVNILCKLLLIPLHVVDWFTEKVGGSHD